MKTKNNILYWITLAIAAIVFYVLNVFTTLKPDDVMYSLVMGNAQEHIDGFGSLMRSQAFHYIDNNGRFANFLTQLFCGILGKPLFNICNALVTAVFLHSAATLIARRCGSIAALSLALLFVMLLMPVPGETMLWLCGSFNYLWSATATLLILVWMARDSAHRQASWWKHCMVFVLTLFAGAMNESVTACTLLALVIYFAFNRQEFTGLVRTAVLGYAVGVAVIFVSPALWTRLDAGGDVNLHISTAQMLSRRLINTCTKSVHFVTPILALAAIVLALFHRKFAQLRTNILVWTFLCSILMIMVLSITTSYRSYTTFALYSFLVVAQLLYVWICDKRWCVWATAAMLAASAVLAVPAVRDTYKYKQYDDRVIADIIASPAECILPASKTPVVSRWVYPVVYDNDGYMTHKYYYCCYYGKDNLQFLAPEIYARYQSGDMLLGGKPAALVPADSTRVMQLMTFDGQPYSIADMGTDTLCFANTHARVYYESMEDHLGVERTAKLKRWGEFPEFMPMPMYYLKQDGHYYLVLPELEPDIVAIEVPLMKDGKEQDLRFEKTHDSK
ncbi:MAG: hypothetical protein J6S96_08685 [Muribaculaceae bacterium]|nr:hypothetical protein [Muribaculaceae bacterium]